MSTKRKEKTCRVRATLRGKEVMFRGYDGQDYLARVTQVRHGVATLTYEVDGETVTAYVDDATRLFSSD